MPRLGLGLDLSALLARFDHPDFNPTSLFTGGKQGIYLAPWDLTTLLDTDRVNQVTAPNQAVGKVLDLSGNTNHAEQTTVARQPVYKVDANSRPYLEFDGIDDFMSFSNLSLFRNVPGATAIAVVKFRTLVGSGKYIFQATTSSGLSRISLNPSTKLSVGGRRLDADSFVQITETNNYAADTFYVYTGFFDYANRILRLRVNGSLSNELLTFQTSGSTNDTNSNFIGIAANIGAASPASIDLYGLIVVPRALTDTELANAEAFLMSKIGL